MNDRKWLTVLLLLVVVAVFAPVTAFAAGGDTFSVIYKTNAGTTMGTVEYTVDDTANHLPQTSELSTLFSDFVGKAAQNGSIYVPGDGVLWYEDPEFTRPAQFPEGVAGETYTVYCKLTVGAFNVGDITNQAEHISYADIGQLNYPYLALDSWYINGRNDSYRATKVLFEKKNSDGQWVSVPEEMYKDARGNIWADAIFFDEVADSGEYRVKAVRYTATDSTGTVLYYVDAEGIDPEKEYTVRIDPVELTISDVTAQDRICDGTNEVQLSAGVLNGILYGDDVSYDLGVGTVANLAAQGDLPVETKITLTGADAGNYVLKQPEGVTVTITHIGGEDTCVHGAVCSECGVEYGQKDPSNHKNLVKVDEKPATEQSTGNIAYWYCADCGTYFTDPNGKNEVNPSDVIIPKLPVVTAGVNGVWSGEIGGLGFTFDGVYGNPVKISVDGNILDEQYYTIAKGNTGIILASEYLKTLSAGEHVLSVEFADGTATAEFTVAELSPDTGESADVLIWAVLLMVAGATLIGCVSCGKMYTRE